MVICHVCKSEDVTEHWFYNGVGDNPSHITIVCHNCHCERTIQVRLFQSHKSIRALIDEKE